MENTQLTSKQDAALQEYANYVYKRVSEDMNALPKEEYGAPHLIIIGETHMDLPLSESMAREPSMGAAYVHVSTLKAAIDRFGRDEVVFSVELPQEALLQVTNAIKNGDVPYHYQKMPAYHAVKYAVDQGISLIGIDDYAHDLLDKLHVPASVDYERYTQINERREQAMKNGIFVGAGAVKDGEASIVVHVGGVDHLSGFMDISEKATLEERANRGESTLEKHFDRVHYYDATVPMLERKLSLGSLVARGNEAAIGPLDEQRFREQSGHDMTRFDPPPEAGFDLENVVERVNRAAQSSSGLPMEALQEIRDLLRRENVSPAQEEQTPSMPPVPQMNQSESLFKR